jgi:hypothetical protein
MTTWFRRALRMGVAGVAVLAGATGAQAASAMAIGECGAYGFAYDYAQAEAARKAAQEKCTGACRIVNMQRACAAFAIDGRNVCGAHGYAVASRLGQAQNTALKHCYKYGGRDCMIRAWACDGRGG